MGFTYLGPVLSQIWLSCTSDYIVEHEGNGTSFLPAVAHGMHLLNSRSGNAFSPPSSNVLERPQTSAGQTNRHDGHGEEQVT